MRFTNTKKERHNTMYIKLLMFQRTTNRYKKIGTVSSNQGYLAVDRDSLTGRFIPKDAYSRLVSN